MIANCSNEKFGFQCEVGNLGNESNEVLCSVFEPYGGAYEKLHLAHTQERKKRTFHVGIKLFLQKEDDSENFALEFMKKK